MKRVLLAAAVAALSFVGWSADVRDYVQKGLVAQWDGVRNQGAGRAHSADATTWVDCIGGRAFELENVTIGESYLQFAGSTTSRGVLDAAGTQAVFEKYGPSGTIEYVFLHEGSTSAIILKSSKASGVAMGWTGTTIFSSVSEGPVYAGDSSTYKNKFTSMSVAYLKAAYARALYVNGESKALSGSNYWGETPTQTFIGCRGSGTQYPFTGKLYAIRVYDHTLTSEEVAQNYAVDVKRFVEGDTSDGSDALVVEGFPEAHGEVSPGYGVTNALVAGNSFVCSAPSEVLGSDEAREAICLGYVLYTRGTGVSDDWVEAGHDSATSFTYVHPEGAGSKLVWKWKTALGIKPKLAIVSSAFGKSEVEATVKGIGLTAESATLTFRYGTTPDCADGSVSVNVTDAGECCATLPHLVGGQSYYVKATLDNLIDTPVVSETLPFAQPKYLEHVLPVGYTKVDYVASSGKQFVDTGVNGRDGVEIRSKMEWVSVPSEGVYIGSRGENDTRLYIVYCYKPAWSFGYLNYLSGTVKPSAGVPYDVYVSLAPGDQRIVVDGVTVKEEIDSRSVDTMRPIYLFAYNYDGTPSLYCSAKCYSLQIWDRGVLKRDYMPCYSDAESACGLYDLVSGTFSKSATTTALNAPTVSADERSVGVVSSDATSATLAIAKNASGSTLYRVDGVSYGGEDVAAWGSVADLGTVAASDAPVERTAALNAGWGESVWMTRFFLVTGTTTNWTETVIWQDTSKPVVDAIAADGIGGDRIVVTGHLESFPGGSCRLYAVVSESEDVLAHPIAGADSGEITVDAAGGFTLTLNDATDALFVPGSVRYVQVMAVANGKTGASPVAEVRLAGKPVFGAVTASTSRRTITVTGSLTDLGVNPPRTVELWAGDAGALAKVAETTVDTAGKSFTLTYDYPLFEHNYQWQLRVAAETANGNALDGDPTPATNAKTLDTTTYTWTGNGENNSWTNSVNWDDGKSGDSLGFPQTTAATAKFTKNADVEIDLPRSGTTLNVGTLNLGAADIDVRFHSADTNSCGLVLKSITVPGQRSRWTIDHAYVYCDAEQKWSAGSTIVLTNSAYLYIGNNNMANAAGVTMILADESYLSCYTVYLGNGSTNIINNSTFYTRYDDNLGNKAGEALVRFEGTHPLWWHNNKDRYFYSGFATTEMHFDFLVPEEGYDAAPIQCIATQNKLAGNNNNTKGAGSLTVNVLDESPLAFVRGEHEVPLISWPKSGINTAAFILGNVPHEVPGSEFVWGEGTSPKTLSAKIVGYVSDGFLLVKSNEEELDPDGFDADSGYGKHEISVGSSLTLTAPTDSVDLGDDWHADIVGWELWSKLDDASDDLTLVRSSTNNPAAGENAYTCHYTHEHYSELVWLWARTRPLGFGSSLSRASSAVGESDIAVEVSGLGYTNFQATLTFAYGRTAECSDGTVTVPVDGLGEWRAKIPLLMTGVRYYVKATLSNDRDMDVSTAIYDFVQPEVAEPRLYTFESYAKGGLLAQWDGIYNVGIGRHDDAATGWTDLSAGHYDLTGISAYGAFTSDGEFRKSESGAKKFSFGLSAETYEVACDLTGYSSGWIIPLSLSDAYYPNLCIRDGKLEMFYGYNKYGFKINVPEGRKFTLTCSKSGALYVNGVPAENCPGYESKVSYWEANDDCTFGGSSVGHGNKDTKNHGFYAIRLYEQKLTAEEIALNAAIDRNRFFEVGVLDVGLEFQNGQFVVTAPAADEPRTVSLYAGATYGGVDGWGEPVTAVLAAGETTVSFSKPDGWGSTVWFARAKVGDGDGALWSKTAMPEPAAPLGMSEALSLASSSFGSSEIAAQVTGIGLNAASATLTFVYGSTPDMTDGAVVLTVTDAGTWTATLPGLKGGQKYYVQATLSNGNDPDVIGELPPFNQPESPEHVLPLGYAKVEYVESSGKEYVDTKINARDGLEVRTKMMWKSAPNTCGYLAAMKTGDTRVLPVYCYPAKWDYGYRVHNNNTTVPLTANVIYDVYSILAPGDQRLVVNGVTALQGTDASSIDIGIPLYLFALNSSGSAGYYSSARCYSLQIWERGELTRDYVPCYSKADSAYGLYDMANGEFYKSGNANALNGPEVPANDRGINLVSFGATSATLAIAKGATASTLCRVNGATYGGENVAKWGSVTDLGTVAASDANVEQSAEFGPSWGAEARFARFFLVTGTTTNWSETAIWQDPNIPAVTLGELDGLGGDTMVVNGTVESLGGTSCTLTAYVGADEDSLTNVWAGVDGSIRTEAGSFAIKLFENDTTASRYLEPGKTYFVRVEAMSPSGKKAWSGVQSVTMAKEAAFKSQSSTVSSLRTMTVTASMADLGMTGETTVQLWAGPDAGSLVMVTNAVVTNVNANFTLSYELPAYETPYVWQLKAVNTSEGGTASATVEGDPASQTAQDKATYTWTGEGGDGKWSNPENWSSSAADCIGYPASAGATATVNMKATIDVDVKPTIKTLSFGSSALNVVFTSADTNSCGLTAGMTVPPASGCLTLDHVAINNTSGKWDLLANSTFELRNGADFYMNDGFDPAKSTGVKLLLSGRSTMRTTWFYMSKGSYVEIDDSTLTTAGAVVFTWTDGDTRVLFKGAAPKWIATSSFYVKYAVGNVALDFEVPVDGWQSAPIAAPNSGSVMFASSAAGSLCTFNVCLDSPAARTNATLESVPLVSWPKGISKANAEEGTIPNELGQDEFIWDDPASPTALSVKIVGSTHEHGLTVAGVPEEVLDDKILPVGYGNNDDGEPKTLTAPEGTVYFESDLRRATCLGWKLYDMDFATHEATLNNSGTGLSYSWTSPGHWQKFEWQWLVENKVTVVAPAGVTVTEPERWVPLHGSVTIPVACVEGTDIATVEGGVYTGDAIVVGDVTGPVTVTMTTGDAWYVKTDGDDGADGRTRETAFATMDKALASAQDGDTIRVAAGEYAPTATMTVSKRVAVFGAGRDETVFRGGVVTFIAMSMTSADARIKDLSIVGYTNDNFQAGCGVNMTGGTLENVRIAWIRQGHGQSGSMSSGTGVYMSGGMMTNCVVENCLAWGSYGSTSGVGIYMTGGTVVDCDILRNARNRNEFNGAGVYVAGASARVAGCRIIGNNSGGQGLGNSNTRGMGICQAKGLVEDCLIVSNAHNGVKISGGTMRNCLVTGHVGTSQDLTAGVEMSGGTMENCTVADNSAPNAFAGFKMTGGTAVNNIIAANGTLGAALVSGGTFKANVIDAGSVVTTESAEGNLVADPKFADVAAGDFTVGFDSPAVDAAEQISGVTHDLAGVARPQGKAPDIGCYEFCPSAGELQCAIIVKTTAWRGDQSPTAEARVAGGSGTYTYAWYVDGELTGQTGATPVFEGLACGWHSLKVVVSDGVSSVTQTADNAFTLRPREVWVDLDGSDEYPYDTPAKAAHSVNEAFDAVWSENDSVGVVHVAAGEYLITKRLDLLTPYEILGAGRDETVFRGGDVDFIAVAMTTKDSKVKDLSIVGFTNSNFQAGCGVNMTAGWLENVRIAWIRQGNGQGVSPASGTGLCVSGGTATNCVIEDCQSYGNYNSTSGIGVYISGGTLVDSVIRRNDRRGCPASGLGVRVNGTAAKVIRCRIVENGLGTTVGSENRAMGLSISAGLVENCVIVSNGHHAVSVSGGTLRNCLVTGHAGTSASYTAGVEMSGGTMENCTVADNSAPNAFAGLKMTGGTAVNNIIAVTSTLGAALVTGGTFDANIVDEGSVITAASATGNLVTDPCFRNPSAVDFTVGFDSPAVDAGVSRAGVTHDLVGTARPQGKAPDIGCYEFCPSEGELECAIIVKTTAWRDDQSPTVEARVAGGSGTYTYAWYVDGELTDQTGATPVFEGLACGWHSLKVVVSDGVSSVTQTADNAFTLRPREVWVDLNGSDDYPYDTPAKAAHSVNEAFDAVWSENDSTGVVHVAAGEYPITKRLDLLTPYEILGAGRDETVFRGGEVSFIAVSMTTAGSKVKDLSIVGFTNSNFQAGCGVNMTAGWLENVRIAWIRQGNGQYASPAAGTGLCISGGMATNCVIENCQSYGTYGTTSAIGVYITGGTLVDSAVCRNDRRGCPGSSLGIKVGNAAAKVVRCRIAENGLDTAVGEKNRAMGLSISAGLVENCVIVSNGHHAASVSGGTLRNCLVTGHVGPSASYTAGVEMSGGTIVNCTLAGNTNTAEAAVSDLKMSGGTAKNTIARFATVTGGTADPSVNCFNEPVAFKSPARNKFMLTAEATNCIDKGDDSVWDGIDDPRDLAGRDRIFLKGKRRYARVDIGCYEFSPAGTVIIVR